MRGEESVWTPTRKRIEAWDCSVYTVWIETTFELAKKTAKWWDDIEAKVQPMVADLFDTAAKVSPGDTAPAPARPAVRRVGTIRRPT